MAENGQVDSANVSLKDMVAAYRNATGIINEPYKLRMKDLQTLIGGSGGGAGSGEIIDCGDRTSGTEITDLGNRV
jgi:hypothetical protein